MITVIFSTKNSSARIERTLRSFAELNTVEQWKLVVIDNGSTDETFDILSGYKNSLPITILSEPKPGKNRGLNKGLPFIEGDLVVFTDDDVRFDGTWLNSIRKVANENPQFDIFAGEILPEWEIEPPSWIERWAPLGHLYAIKRVKHGAPCAPGKVWGPNMFVRAKIFEDLSNRFDERVGPNGTPNYPMGSETDFTTRMEKKGHSCWESPEFRVFHWIPKENMSESWVYGRAFRLGNGVTLAKKLQENILPSRLKSVMKYWVFNCFYFSTIMLPLNARTFWLRYKRHYHKGITNAVKISGLLEK